MPKDAPRVPIPLTIPGDSEDKANGNLNGGSALGNGSLKSSLAGSRQGSISRGGGSRAGGGGSDGDGI